MEMESKMDQPFYPEKNRQRFDHPVAIIDALVADYFSNFVLWFKKYIFEACQYFACPIKYLFEHDCQSLQLIEPHL